jgi:hypothetical protein
MLGAQPKNPQKSMLYTSQLPGQPLLGGFGLAGG